MTGGGDAAKVDERKSRLLALSLFLLLGSAVAAVNALSVIDERERMARPVAVWQPWCWELTSLAGLLVVAPIVMRLSQRIRPPRFSWSRTLAFHAAASVPISLLHNLVLMLLRSATYVLMGQVYSVGAPIGRVLLYEYRKDALTYAILALLPFVADRLLEARRRRGVGRGADDRLQVRAGSRTIRVAPHDIEWAQAAGNYVELFGSFGTLLHRMTLAALAEELGSHRFVRIHRSRIVRAEAIASVAYNTSGDFEVTLVSGTRLGGSRRYRQGLPL